MVSERGLSGFGGIWSFGVSNFWGFGVCATVVEVPFVVVLMVEALCMRYYFSRSAWFDCFLFPVSLLVDVANVPFLFSYDLSLFLSSLSQLTRR